MKYLTILAFVASTIICYAQKESPAKDSSYFIILNEKGKTLDRFDMGEKIKIKLKNSTIIKGVIHDIKRDSLQIDDSIVLTKEIAKLANVKKQQKNAIIGGAMIVASVATIFVLRKGADISLQSAEIIAGLALVGVISGAIVMTPKRHTIGKSNVL